MLCFLKKEVQIIPCFFHLFPGNLTERIVCIFKAGLIISAESYLFKESTNNIHSICVNQ